MPEFAGTTCLDRNDFQVSPYPAVNVASVPQRSPLRYPGGKTWLIPHVQVWLGQLDPIPELLLEPFCGGGIISLSAVMENWTERCLMCELDRDVAAFWHAALHHGPALVEKVMQFQVSRSTVDALAGGTSGDVLEHGFRTLVLNRTRRGGILAPGAAFTKVGENGKGLASRWYPKTLAQRLRAISASADRIGFLEGNGMALLESVLATRGNRMAVFVDPPYTAGGKSAGKRLYTQHALDHAKLFGLLHECGTEFLMTYDEAPEIVALIRKHGFRAVRVVMKNGHHNRIAELVITPRAVFK